MSTELKRVPWFVPEAVAWLDARIEPSWRAFEWGSGGSTLWLAERCAEVQSVEHDPDWWALVRGALEEVPGAAATVTLLPPGEGDGYRSSCVPGSFRSYVEEIDGKGPFDVVFVDGRARASCLAHAVDEASRLIVLDNAERAWYLRDTEDALDWWGKRRDFAREGWITAVWERR